MLGWRSVLISLAVIVGAAIVGAIIGGVAIPESRGFIFSMSHADWAIAGAMLGALGGVVFAILFHFILWLRSVWRWAARRRRA